ncbi:MAG TPA: hypothetical protein VFV52_13240 [Bacilli bacterium]|nr:hypothetical protein [Bacilli bacterium]
MSGIFMAFTWGLSLVAALLATALLKAPRWLSIILGLILAQGLMFVSVHQLGWMYGPMVDMGGTVTPVVMDIIVALVGAFVGAALARAFRRGR